MQRKKSWSRSIQRRALQAVNRQPHPEHLPSTREYVPSTPEHDPSTPEHVPSTSRAPPSMSRVPRARPDYSRADQHRNSSSASTVSTRTRMESPYAGVLAPRAQLGFRREFGNRRRPGFFWWQDLFSGKTLCVLAPAYSYIEHANGPLINIKAHYDSKP